MNRLEERNRKFLTYWKKRREHKRKYVALAGVWPLFIAILAYLWTIDLKLPDIDVVQFGLQIIVYTSVGVWYGLWSYKKHEKMYQELLAAKDTEQA
ncbi:hypothetical protein ACMA1I_07230 [Pontibacter sp. 13R65]|uniref:hypothetical protein n=1 Tax=Pontibacter sp. 13R65 TaxID=3127458 RepID=UPI00301D5A68